MDTNGLDARPEKSSADKPGGAISTRSATKRVWLSLERWWKRGMGGPYRRTSCTGESGYIPLGIGGALRLEEKSLIR